MSTRFLDGIAGVNVPMEEIVNRVVLGVPVVVQYRRVRPLWAYRRWSWFTLGGGWR